jgi:8-oxo-dGTP pyrophosphatase MutT (NUDIX family)
VSINTTAPHAAQPLSSGPLSAADSSSNDGDMSAATDGQPRDQGACRPCVAQLNSPADRLAALLAVIAVETEPLVTLTHLLQLCRDEHMVLWERVSDPTCQDQVAQTLSRLEEQLSVVQADQALDATIRTLLTESFTSTTEVPPVVIAHALAQFLDLHYAHSFTRFFRERSPYQPAVGDPVPLDFPNLRALTPMPFTSPPWRLANRLDQTLHIRLAGDWATQYRMVFDYSLTEAMAGLITADTMIATCHPNRSVSEFSLPCDAYGRTFPIQPIDLDRQREEVNRLIGVAADAGADIVVLPELCVTEDLAVELQQWVRRPNGLRLLVVGSYHHHDNGSGPYPGRKRNTALVWARGYERPFTHDKHSPGESPIAEDIQPSGWPELRIHVIDGWHLVIAICRDLLNPEAVHALTAIGANLVLVPAMSETLLAFGGQGSSLVGNCQAIVAVANNPGEWPSDSRPPSRPARALFGHPGLTEQTVAVHSEEPGPGVALFTVKTAQVTWIPSPISPLTPPTLLKRSDDEPEWLDTIRIFLEQSRSGTPNPNATDGLRPAATLVLLVDSDNGPNIVLTERASALANYPGILVFPGGSTEANDDGPVATALRETVEETGIDTTHVHIIGSLPPLIATSFLVTPVVGWCPPLHFANAPNPIEVADVVQIPLREFADTSDRVQRNRPTDATGFRFRVGETAVGDMTSIVINSLLGHPD